MGEKGGKVDRMSEAEGVANRSSQRARFATQLEGLVRVAEVPQVEREITTMRHASVVAGVGCPIPRALTVVIVGQRLFVAGTSGHEASSIELCNPRHEQRFH